jgi:hypothetical protein
MSRYAILVDVNIKAPHKGRNNKVCCIAERAVEYRSGRILFSVCGDSNQKNMSIAMTIDDIASGD